VNTHSDTPRSPTTKCRALPQWASGKTAQTSAKAARTDAKPEYRVRLERIATFDGPVIAKELPADESFDLCLYNAGMDPHEGCAIGGLAGIDAAVLAEREHHVFAWCRARKLPVAFAMAGGYLGPGLDEAGVVALHRLTLEAAAASARETSSEQL